MMTTLKMKNKGGEREVVQNLFTSVKDEVNRDHMHCDTTQILTDAI